MKWIMTLILMAATFAAPQKAAADGRLLLTKNCLIQEGGAGFGVGGFMGMSCQDMKSKAQQIELVTLTLAPVAMVIQNTWAAEVIVADLAAAGLTFANPVVLSVTVVGAIGVTTFYLALKMSINECEAMEKEDLKREILRELKQEMNLRGSGSVPLEIRSQ